MDAVNVSHVGDRTEIRLTGRFVVGDMADAHRCLSAALDRRRPIVLDGAAVSGIDTAGLQLLAVFCAAARARGLGARWLQASTPLRENAAMLGLSELLALEDTADVHH